MVVEAGTMEVVAGNPAVAGPELLVVMAVAADGPAWTQVGLLQLCHLDGLLQFHLDGLHQFLQAGLLQFKPLKSSR